jgi:hypothetical protein
MEFIKDECAHNDEAYATRIVRVFATHYDLRNEENDMVDLS